MPTRSTKEVVTYITGNSRLFFTKNLFGPFTIQMPNDTQHYITIKEQPSTEDYYTLVLLLTTIMPEPSQLPLSDLDTEVFLYQSIEIGDKQYQSATTEELDKTLQQAINATKFPFTIKLVTYPNSRPICRKILRFLYEPEKGFSKQQVISTLTQVCL